MTCRPVITLLTLWLPFVARADDVPSLPPAAPEVPPATEQAPTAQQAPTTEQAPTAEQAPPPPPVTPPHRPSGPNANNPNAMSNTGRAYSPRTGYELNLRRLVTTPCTESVPALVGLCRSEEWWHLLASLGTWDLNKKDDTLPDYSPRVLTAEVAGDAVVYDAVPWIPYTPEQADYLPDSDYVPRWIGETEKGISGSVAVGFKPPDANFRPTATVQFRNGFGARPDAIEVNLNAGVDHNLQLAGLPGHLSVWGQVDRTLTGYLNINGGLGLGAGLVLEEGTRMATRFSVLGQVWQPEHIFTRTTHFEAEQALGLAGGHLLMTGGATADLRYLDPEVYTYYSGLDAPFTNTVDIGVNAALLVTPLENIHLGLGWQQLFVHAEDPYLDAFYRPTGPQFDLTVSAIGLGVIDVTAGYTWQQWEGMGPSATEGGDPEMRIWSAELLGVKLGGRF